MKFNTKERRCHYMQWDKIQKYLNKRGWSLLKLSKISGVPEGTLKEYKFKSTEPSFKNACKIADALGVSLDELRGDKDEVNTRR
jgi:transcriptional regulator with XRE-family HTH domain